MFERLYAQRPGLVEQPWFSQAGTLDLEEKEKEFRVRVDVHTFTPEEISVEASEQRLLIRARHEMPPEDKAGEEMMMMMARRIDLPSRIDVGKVTVRFNKGWLEVVLPRTTESSPPRTIEVTT